MEKRTIFLILVILIISGGYLRAQDSSDKEQLNKDTVKALYNEIDRVSKKDSTADKNGNWVKNGEINILFSQSGFSNWYQGGENSVSATSSLKYFLTYENDRNVWDSRLWLAYGFNSLESDSFYKKTQDVIELNSVYGLKLTKEVFLSGFLNFRTQFSKGYTYEKVDGVSVRHNNSNFLSPGILKIGTGALWKKSDNFKVNFSPLTANLIFVDKKYTLPDGKYFGVKEGESIRVEVGANLEGSLKFKLLENVDVSQILTFYANYLEKFGNIDIYYRLSILMTINKFLSANFNFDAIYNDNVYPGLQRRQILGIGINYNF